jgi:hypothetical protein
VKGRRDLEWAMHTLRAMWGLWHPSGSRQAGMAMEDCLVLCVCVCGGGGFTYVWGVWCDGRYWRVGQPAAREVGVCGISLAAGRQGKAG